MTHDDSPLHDTYIWKSTTIIAGVYLFFLTERFLKMIMNFRRVSKSYPLDLFYTIENAVCNRGDSLTDQLSIAEKEKREKTS